MTQAKNVRTVSCLGLATAFLFAGATGIRYLAAAETTTEAASSVSTTGKDPGTSAQSSKSKTSDERVKVEVRR